MKNIEEIIENCRVKLESDPFECYVNGVFIVSHINNFLVKESRWFCNSDKANEYYLSLKEDETVIDIKLDYRYFGKKEEVA